MNALVEFEAKRLADLLHKGDLLSIHMFMDSMSMPFDVQSKLMSEFASLKSPDHNSIAALIESHSNSSLNEYLGY
ncbi:hypothetical protein [Shewanella sp. Isolate11]|uniref:hypothetical protein n=1 Tax=Shewanella sp. Isolate11 TaxID=2908530 RepID=UPI001EFE3D86|nr:hypothetical protein [Shewanella sp. Isolate11]MCG9696320.1 hypothetical protein [Shewanella sp. Isolate11]